MQVSETPIAGAFIIEPETSEDDRGLFARVLDRLEFKRLGLEVPSDQWSTSFNRRRGTLRGLHYQAAPAEEVKIVRCTSGAVFDVIVDLTTRRWFSVELSAVNRRSLYVPRGMAHGFQTLTDEAEVFYAIEGRYEPRAARGIRWDDPSLAIAWPAVADRILSDRDRALPWLSE